MIMEPAGVSLTTRDEEDIGANIQYISVEAPATLPAGYTFEVEHANKMYYVTVPEGGVRQGDRFEAPAAMEDGGDLSYHRYVMKGVAVEGQWKDHWFVDFFKYGYCHASSCCALWCTPLSMGQTMVRAGLNWLGDPIRGKSTVLNPAFKIVAAIYGFYVIFSFLLEIISPTPPAGQEDEYNYPPEIAFLKAFADIAFSLYTIFAMTKARESVRHKFNIPSDERCGGCEDFLCAAFCSCCTAAQLSRQVNSFEEYDALCFSESGSPEHAPKLI